MTETNIIFVKKVFDVVNINLRAKPEWYFSIHPLRHVPSVQKGDFKAYKSLVVAEYLEEKFTVPRLEAETPELKAKESKVMGEVSR